MQCYVPNMSKPIVNEFKKYFSVKDGQQNYSLSDACLQSGTCALNVTQLTSFNLNSSQFQNAINEAYFEVLWRIDDKLSNTITKEELTEVKFREKTIPQTVDEEKAVIMKTYQDLVDERILYQQIFNMIEKNVKQNTRLMTDLHDFLLECVHFVRNLTNEILFIQKPLDFFSTLKKKYKKMSTVTILYCVYDLIYTNTSFLRLKKRPDRHLIEQKVIKQPKRAKYYAIIMKGGVTFTSKYVSEVLLQLIENNALRCSSLSKIFLVTQEETTFYKYCLISGKVCLKRIVERSTIKI